MASQYMQNVEQHISQHRDVACEGYVKWLLESLGVCGEVGGYQASYRCCRCT